MRKLSIQNIDGKHIWQEHHDNYDQMSFLPRKMVERELSDESLFEIKILDEKIPPMQNYTIYKSTSPKRKLIQRWLNEVNALASIE